MATTETKPDWVSEERWKMIPYAGWWDNQKRGMEYIAQSKPVSTEEKINAQRIRNERAGLMTQ